MQRKHVRIEASLPVSFLKEGNRFVAYTPALDLSTSGKTYREAQNRFDEAVQLFFEELFAKGTLDDVLCGLGWKKNRARWSPPVVIAHDIRPVTV